MSFGNRKEKVLIGTRIAEKKPPLAVLLSTPATCPACFPHAPELRLWTKCKCFSTTGFLELQMFGQAAFSCSSFQIQLKNSQTGILPDNKSLALSVLSCAHVPGNLTSFQTMRPIQQVVGAGKHSFFTVKTNLYICLNAHIHGN